jgi:hypothetical protein
MLFITPQVDLASLLREVTLLELSEAIKLLVKKAAARLRPKKSRIKSISISYSSL